MFPIHGTPTSFVSLSIITHLSPSSTPSPPPPVAFHFLLPFFFPLFLPPSSLSLLLFLLQVRELNLLTHCLKQEVKELKENSKSAAEEKVRVEEVELLKKKHLVYREGGGGKVRREEGREGERERKEGEGE